MSDRFTEIARARGFAPALAFLTIAPLVACSGASPDEGPLGAAERALAKVYQVGPTRSYKTLQAVAPLLAPGDVVEVDGNATYPGGVRFEEHGTASAKITVRGVRVAGKRPVISGGINGIELAGDHYVLEGMDVTGSSSRCVFHHADDITVRDSIVRDCPAHGILGADSDSGSLTLEYVEVARCGAGTTKHPIYIATDEEAHPGSVFRMQHCYVHDANGGNAVKSRAERNEIYYNWIEGGLYKELELIGPDGQDPDLAREDSDVVGNVFRKTHTQYVVRIGGDGTGDTYGRYRFVNNTFLLAQGSAAAIHAFDGVESVELYNNVFHRVGGGAVTILKNDASWATGSQIFVGGKNAVPSGTSVPSGWTGTIVANDPGFVDVASRDVRLKSTSVLVDKGAASTPSPAGFAFPGPLATPAFLPPPGVVQALGTATARPVVGAIDIGAFEYGTAAPPPTGEGGGSGGGSTGGTPPAACVQAGVDVWKTAGFPTQSGKFTASWDVTPSEDEVDGAVALALGTPSAWADLAVIVRFNPAGTIDVRNAGTYAADANIAYAAGKTYHVRAVVDVATHSYSVYVTPPGGSETAIAQGYAFRTQQLGVTSLNTWVVNQVGTSGTLAACGFSIQ